MVNILNFTTRLIQLACARRGRVAPSAKALPVTAHGITLPNAEQHNAPGESEIAPGSPFHRGQVTLPNSMYTAPNRPVRVVRIREPRQPRHHAGKLLISGRMADVCAELERLAEAHPEQVH